MSAFAKSLRSARQIAGLTQEQLGFEVGVTKASVSAWENSREFPSFTVLLRLRQVLRLSLDELVGDMAPGVKEHSSEMLYRDPGRAHTERELALLQRFRNMNLRRQDAFLEIMRPDS